MSDFDPTTNRVPFQLMTEDAKKTLKEWPHGFEFYSFHNDLWEITRDPAWTRTTVYRGKLAPVVITTWSPIYSDGRVGSAYYSHEDAVKGAGSHILLIAVLRIDTCNGVSTAHLEAV